jgi:hypothetical protein
MFLVCSFRHVLEWTIGGGANHLTPPMVLQDSRLADSEADLRGERTIA